MFFYAKTYKYAKSGFTFFLRKVDLANGGKPADVEWCEDDANAPIPKDRALHQGGKFYHYDIHLMWICVLLLLW